MTTSKPWTIADAVVAVLNAAYSPATFTATSQAAPLASEIKDLTNLVVTVVPAALEEAERARGSELHDAIIDVGLQKACGEVAHKTVANSVANTAEAVLKTLRDYGLVGSGGAFVSGSIISLCNPDHLRQYGVVTAVVRVRYRVEI